MFSWRPWTYSTLKPALVVLVDDVGEQVQQVPDRSFRKSRGWKAVAFG